MSSSFLKRQEQASKLSVQTRMVHSRILKDAERKELESFEKMRNWVPRSLKPIVKDSVAAKVPDPVVERTPRQLSPVEARVFPTDRRLLSPPGSSSPPNLLEPNARQVFTNTFVRYYPPPPSVRRNLSGFGDAGDDNGSGDTGPVVARHGRWLLYGSEGKVDYSCMVKEASEAVEASAQLERETEQERERGRQLNARALKVVALDFSKVRNNNTGGNCSSSTASNGGASTGRNLSPAPSVPHGAQSARAPPLVNYRHDNGESDGDDNGEGDGKDEDNVQHSFAHSVRGKKFSLRNPNVLVLRKVQERCKLSRFEQKNSRYLVPENVLHNIQKDLEKKEERKSAGRIGRFYGEVKMKKVA
eukprot:ANDGO_08334.mRNA.1 hypothetical protein